MLLSKFKYKLDFDVGMGWPKTFWESESLREKLTEAYRRDLESELRRTFGNDVHLDNLAFAPNRDDYYFSVRLTGSPDVSIWPFEQTLVCLLYPQESRKLAANTDFVKRIKALYGKKGYKFKFERMKMPPSSG